MMPQLAQMRLWIEIALWRHGWLWPISAGFAAMTLLLCLGLIPQERERLHDLERQVHQLRIAPRIMAKIPESPSEQELAHARINATLQPTASTVQQLDAILKSANAHGIRMDSASYQEHQDKASGLTRLEVSMPLKSTYPQLRMWLDDALRMTPNLSLDRIEFSREAISESSIAANVSLSLWRHESGSP